VHIQILGTRGIPSGHGGFETFAQDLALYLVDKGHSVTVYCQVAEQERPGEDFWRGIRRVRIPASDTAQGTIGFDLKSVLHAVREKGVALTFGYNTAIFSVIYRVFGHPHVMNMDGIEWKRKKWSKPARIWLRMNEWLGARLANHLIADHPRIADHLSRHTSLEKIAIIPYGSEEKPKQDDAVLERYRLVSGKYYLVIARPEPENSLLEIVSAYSARKRTTPLVVLGKYVPTEPYHAEVLANASTDVLFPGAIYDRPVVATLRSHAQAYIHGHQVGGTNPSLVESLAVGNAVIAHDNVFTRWVNGNSAMYFRDEASLRDIFDTVDGEPEMLEPMRERSISRFRDEFRQDSILMKYEMLLSEFSEKEVTVYPEYAPEISDAVTSVGRD
jgi:glycosyltransferase involved in cell wall biosynthesis